MATPLAPVKSFENLPDQELIDLFIKSPLTTAKELLKRPQLKLRFWQLYEKNTANSQLTSAYKKVEQLLGVVPALQTQAVPTPEPPIRTSQQLTRSEPTATLKGNPITPENAPKLQQLLNDFKPKFYEYMTQNKSSSATDAHAFTKSFLNYLSLYRGGLAKFYFDEGVYEMLFSALGPVGDVMRNYYGYDVQRKINWMKNPLNSDSIYYYLNSLPARKAFEVLYLPVKATWGILARGGAPLISKTVYQDWEYDPATGPKQVVKQGYFFAPTLKLAQGINILADGAEKLAGVGKTSQDFKLALDQLKAAKKSNNKSDIRGARWDLRHLLSEHDGKLGQAIFRGSLKNLSRRLKKINRDPIAGLLSLITGTLFDLSVGLVANLARVALNKIINIIPGLNTLRAQLTEFLTSNRFLNTLRIGGVNVGSFVKGVASPTTLSSGYLGYRLGSLLFPNSPWLIAGTTGISGGLGAFYQIALNTAKQGIFGYNGQLNPVGWIQEYNSALAKGDLEAIQKNYLKWGKPGPITKFANWLYERPFARLPINGLVVGDLISPLMQRYFGWSPLATHLVTVGIDYLWQIRGKLAELASEKILQPALRNLTNYYWNNFVYTLDPLQGFVERRWYAWTNKYIVNPLSKAFNFSKPYLQNFFNPGLFMGLNFIPYLTPFLGGWAYLAGPVLGSVAWLGVSRIIQTIVGAGPGFLSSFSAWGWSGYLLGSVLDLIIPGAQPWLATALGIGFPIMGSILALFNLNFIGLVSSLGTAIPAIAGATTTIAGYLGASAVLTSILTVAGLVVFTSSVIYSGLWVPMMEEWRAEPTSTHFAINTACTKLSDNQYQCCADFNLTQDVLNINNYLNLSLDFSNTQLSVNLTNPPAVTTASRNRTGLSYLFNFFELTPSHYSITLPPEGIGPPVVGGYQEITSLLAYLSAPTSQSNSLYNLMLDPKNRNLASSVIPFLELLQEMAKDKLNPEGYTAYFLQGQKEMEKLLNQEKAVLKSLQQKVSNDDLVGAQTFLESKLSDNPVKDPETISCPETDVRCLEYEQAVQSYYDSWPRFINQKLNQIKNLLAAADPEKIAESAVSLEEEFAQTEQAWKSQQQLVDKLQKISYEISDADSEVLTDPEINIRNFTSLPDDIKEKLWEILASYFGEAFGSSSQYYYLPKGTNYNFCAIIDYCLNNTVAPPVFNNCEPVPQTVCSTIYSQTNYFTGSAFAKSCATFTP